MRKRSIAELLRVGHENQRIRRKLRRFKSNFVAPHPKPCRCKVQKNRAALARMLEIRKLRDQGKTLQAIGTLFGITRERIRQLELKARRLGEV